MASPELAIAKAALSASLFRSDPSSLSRPAVDDFFSLLSSTVKRCTRDNVQQCKAWIADNVVHSPARVASLAKFLVALSKSSEDDGQRPSVRRRRLHVLYIINDVIFHTVVRLGESGFSAQWEPFVLALMASAGAFERCPKHKSKLERLIDLWDEKRYFSPGMVTQLRDAAAKGTADSVAGAPQGTTSIKLAKDTPFILTSLHGDSSTQWHDLPAATWLPHLTPNSSKAMQPDLIRPLQLAPGPANKVLTTAVQNLLSDVELMFSTGKDWENDAFPELSGVGERLTLDEVTREALDGDTYYGWSRRFCKKMKARTSRGHSSRRRSRSRSRGRDSRGRSSRSTSPRAYKRRRISSYSRSRSRGRDRSYSRSHSRSRSYGRSPNRERRYSRSQSRSRSRDPNSGGHRSRSNRRRSYSRSASPQPRPLGWGHSEESPPNTMHRSGNMQSIPPPPGMSGLPPPGFPIPPPPPAGYQGPWPPPPIPPPPGGIPPGGWMPNPGIPPPMMGEWAQASPQHFNNYPRGRGGFIGRGRGYDRGRGW